MCNLSDGVERKGIEKGIKQEHLRIIQKKLEKNKSAEEIAEDLELTIKDVEKYITMIKEQKIDEEK